MENKESTINQLVSSFASFDSQTAAKFIADILYYWGIKRADGEPGSVTIAQQPAQSFFTLLSNMDFDEKKIAHRYPDNKQSCNLYSMDQIENIITQLESIKFEDAIEMYASAAYQWLTTADLSPIASKEDSVFDVRLKIYKQWGAYLGVG